MGKEVAVLLTCYNRKAQTIACLGSLFEATIPEDLHLDIYLTDDGSTDGTGDAVKELYPRITLLKGSGNLFWAGGMRLAWTTALQTKPYDAFLLINDDVRLQRDFMINLMKTEEYSLRKRGKTGIYCGTTVDGKSGDVSYGGSRITTNHIVMRSKLLIPKNKPQECQIANANILWVSKEVVDQIGILDDRFTHGIADYDYSLRAHKENIPVYVAPNVCGICTDDHGKSWKKGDLPLRERIAYLKSPKGLAYNEYLYYIRRHFPMFFPYSFVMLWMKTFFPFFWDRLKN
ncbi:MULTISPECIES: glycosyltransferase family 2 protein [Petrimonas]|jgi:GT2 family glycosyltransferase|uniref:Glycosyl transferase family 2 n=1 Tax=Petrimonas mucosa TaxID=1642646 RepID=A0A1G4G8L2_9BACT|nr:MULTISPECIES: glycosyltransferase family 2 protein [Petrimonas]MDD3561204.1 glycosyltransferase family 2 protein [Petrimonas mucosa]SCM58855.1 Glycosyl transferase family 2 {ECO:0000313/EMBL:ADQ80460,1} [Petrimonas mucosa]SFU27325.1 Glycosyltransferase, GT2 family [Porphyromonadaceae bacterium KHP3R9]HHT29558.1 glycosyltransferase family 2 protein [Petrimonas mucosa]